MLQVSNPHKYARIERERRFLVAQAPFVATSAPTFVDIIDTYLPSAQLRLREMRNAAGAAIAYKLTQKYHLPALPPYAVMITNIYLTVDDYALFSSLPGVTLRKRRYSWVEQDAHIAIDVFAGALADLATYVVTSAQLALAFPDAAGGFAASFVKFGAIFAITQIPLAISEGILTVLIFNALQINAEPELNSLGVLKGV